MADLLGRTAYFLVGPTASGKGRLARGLAARFDMEIVSMDSMKVYRLMDIGTAKPGREERRAVRHHLIDVAWPHETFDLASWIERAEKALLDITNRGGKALFYGGTGLYLKGFLSGIFEGPPARKDLREALEAEASRDGPEALHARLLSLDPEAAQRIHPRDTRRLVRALEVIEVTGEPISRKQVQFTQRRKDLEPILVGIHRDREDLNRRIMERVSRQMEAGFLEEVRDLAGRDRPPSRSASQALGYRELMETLSGSLPLEEAVASICRHTRKFVRRQMAWFRRFPDIHWLPVTGEADGEAVLQRAAKAFSLVPDGEFP